MTNALDSTRSLSEPPRTGAAGLRRYRRLARYAAHHRNGWAVIGSVTLLGSLFALLQPWPLKVLVDQVLGGLAPAGWVAAVLSLLPGAADPRGLLIWVVFGGLLIFVATVTIDAILTFAWIRVGQRMAYDLAEDLLAHLQRQALRFHIRTPVGDSLSRVTTDSYGIYTLVAALLVTPLRALVMLSLMIAVMASLEPFLTLVAVAVAPLMALASYHFGQPLRSLARWRREVEARMASHVQRALRNIPAVQAFAAETRERERLEVFAQEALRVHKKGAIAAGLFDLGGGLLSAVGTSVVLWFGALMVIDGRLTVGGLLVFLAYLRTLQGEMRGLLGVYSAVQNAGASVDRVMEVLETQDEVKELPGAVAFGRARGRIEFENVTFGYEPGRPVLEGITLSLAPGETLALMGITGAGKSTLASLIPRFIDPQQGRVLLDGRDVRDMTLASLRTQIALVLQEPFLFPMTVAENIAYARPAANRTDIEAAARAANAHDFIRRLPHGYDTVMGERGATLSGGERQRVAIARAVLKDAPVLILDEPTSALDVETEALVLEALEALMKGRTTLIVAHRFSTLRNADRIAMLENGHLSELGSHDSLMALQGAYWRLRMHPARSRPLAVTQT